MNKILIFILLFLTFSCEDKKTEKIQIQKKKIVNLKTDTIKIKSYSKLEIKKTKKKFIDSTNFKFFNLKEFDLRSWDAGKMNKELKSPTKEKLLEYFQNERINGENIYSTNFRYFSIQKNTNALKVITIIEGDESCCSNLHFLIYNNHNKLISDNIVAGTGGDGAWSYNQYGKFINDSTFLSTRIDTEAVELKNDERETQIDSVITKYLFYKNKSFEKLTEQKFKKIEKN